MIEFEGGPLLSLESSSAQMMVSLTQSGSEAALGSGAISGEGGSNDAVLGEPTPESGDGWIVSLLSGTVRDAATVGTFSPSDGILLDRLSNEDGDGDSGDIFVDGRPLTGRSVTNGSGGGGSGEGSSDGGSGGGSTTGTPAVPVAPHPQDCGTDDGAAAQVAKHVKGELPANVSGPANPVTTATGNDWTKVEFGTMIVRNSDGSFGALNDSIYSNDLPRDIQIHYSSSQPVQGLWHSHPSASFATSDRLIGRYPSLTDWNMLDRIKAGTGAVSDPSLWIMDSWGITREFKYSERDYFKNMHNDDSRMQKGEGLDGRERSESCG